MVESEFESAFAWIGAIGGLVGVGAAVAAVVYAHNANAIARRALDLQLQDGQVDLQVETKVGPWSGTSIVGVQVSVTNFSTFEVGIDRVEYLLRDGSRIGLGSAGVIRIGRHQRLARSETWPVGNPGQTDNIVEFVVHTECGSAIRCAPNATVRPRIAAGRSD